MLNFDFNKAGIMTRRYQANSKLIPAIEKLVSDKCKEENTFCVRTDIEEGFQIEYYKSDSIYNSVEESQLYAIEIFYIRDDSRPSYDLYLQLEYQLYKENKNEQ